MSLFAAPKVGAVVLCIFPNDLAPPEMIKTRPVVIITPQLHGRRDLVGVVPLSTTEPDPMYAHHCEVPIRSMPRVLQADAKRVWAKCDMVYTFSLARLDRFRAGKDRKTGKRLYEVGQLDLADVRAIRIGIAAAFGITAELFDNSTTCDESVASIVVD